MLLQFITGGVTIRPSPLTPLSAVVLGEVLQVPNALTLVSYFIAKYWGGGAGEAYRRNATVRGGFKKGL